MSRAISASVVVFLRATAPNLQVTYRDLAAKPHLSGAYLGKRLRAA